MCNGEKRVTALFLPALFISMLLLSACENDLKKIKEISARQVSQPIEVTTGVEIIRSDSAVVQAKMTTPVLIEHSTAKPFYIMPKGVKVIFYDKAQHETSTITADSGVYRQTEKLIEFHKNVVATNETGDVYRSEELIWDQTKSIMYSNRLVQITMSDGDVLNGINFKSDEKLTHPIMTQSTGVFNVSDNPTK
jgi:LPS export ABC transporter protein LptC